MIQSKSIVVNASNAGTINGKKTTTIDKDVDAAINGLGVDVKSVSISLVGGAFPDAVLVTVLYDGNIESKEEAKPHKSKK